MTSDLSRRHPLARPEHALRRGFRDGPRICEEPDPAVQPRAGSGPRRDSLRDDHLTGHPDPGDRSSAHQLVTVESKIRIVRVPRLPLLR